MAPLLVTLCTRGGMWGLGRIRQPHYSMLLVLMALFSVLEILITGKTTLLFKQVGNLVLVILQILKSLEASIEVGF